jgi:hypothetical protein
MLDIGIAAGRRKPGIIPAFGETGKRRREGLAAPGRSG